MNRKPQISSRAIRRIVSTVLPLFLLTAAGWQPADAQEVELSSRKVGFMIKNTGDTAHTDEPADHEPPTLRLITPAIGGEAYHKTDKKDFDLIGEVKDVSGIKFVSVNSEMREINEYGLFSYRLSLEPGKNRIDFTVMDMNDNVREHSVTFEYIPPVVTLADKISKNSRYFALLIGINEYQDEGIPDLANPIRDAQAFYDALVNHYTFSPNQITFLKNPTRSEIIDELDLLRNRVTSDDNLLIFYAGHGYWDEKGRIGYWLPSDARRVSTVDWFRNSTLVDYLQVIDSKHTLLITDACFAGSIFKARAVKMELDVAYEKIYEMRSRKAMTSGTLTEVPDESAFIKYLIQRLNENEERYLSSEELFSRIRMAVISNSNVVPQYGEIQNVGNEGGDFVFLKKQ
jgi:hypothetical protein